MAGRSGAYPIMMSGEQYEALMLALDPFGIYAQRRLMAKQFPVPIYRGVEWWHA